MSHAYYNNNATMYYNDDYRYYTPCSNKLSLRASYVRLNILLFYVDQYYYFGINKI